MNFLNRNKTNDKSNERYWRMKHPYNPDGHEFCRGVVREEDGKILSKIYCYEEEGYLDSSITLYKLVERKNGTYLQKDEFTSDH